MKDKTHTVYLPCDIDTSKESLPDIDCRKCRHMNIFYDDEEKILNAECCEDKRFVIRHFIVKVKPNKMYGELSGAELIENFSTIQQKSIDISDIFSKY